MEMERSVTITKLDAAKRQLETAIRLYFRDEDPVSIHTLSGAAYNIIRDVSKKRGGPPMFIKDDYIETYIKTEYHQQVRKKLNEPENFFKHADQDPVGKIEFNPDASELMIWDAVSGYFGITGEWTPLFQVFNGWFIATKENLLKAEWKAAYAVPAGAARSVGRTKFFEMMLPVAMRSGTGGRPEK
jgi:hypothetical protein